MLEPHDGTPWALRGATVRRAGGARLERPGAGPLAWGQHDEGGSGMPSRRLETHPILRVVPREEVAFDWDAATVTGVAGESLAAALLAQGVDVFGRHPRDESPQGLFCANGQCAQCMVVADGVPVKACMTPLAEGMRVRPLEGLPALPADDDVPSTRAVERREVDVLVLGGGPAGLAAAEQLGRRGVDTLLIDDKDRLGGKLVLQTHRFFGSAEAVFAGTRGVDIATRLADEVAAHPSVEVWLGSTALAVFGDGWVGVLRPGERYVLVRPDVLVVATGARERSLTFHGNTLPGVYGAGAFQTLLNRDQVRIAERVFVVGGGNVGLITAYHALQAGVRVVGLVEAAAACGGYRVHHDKLARAGVPILTSHTVVSANGTDAVESVTVARVDARFRPVPGSERSFACDAVLVAVGLESVDEFVVKARSAGLRVVAAGDADAVAEASAAIFAGRIRGLEVARTLRACDDTVPEAWERTAEVLRSRPGVNVERPPQAAAGGVRPVFHCAQAIPCDPCASVCPRQLIVVPESDIREVPTFSGGVDACLGCERCVRVCPGLAITLVDRRVDADWPVVTLAFEFDVAPLEEGASVTLLDTVGADLGEGVVTRVRRPGRGADGTAIIKVRVPAALAERVAGVRMMTPPPRDTLAEWVPHLADDDVVCRCERVSAAELRACIASGERDVNALKALTRAGMGACGAKTCAPLIERLFDDAGVAREAVTPGVRRPLFVETSLGAFAGTTREA